MKTRHIIVITDAKDMREISNESAHLIITSPPYWSLKEYGKKQHIGFDQAYEEYIKDIAEVLEESSRILKPGRFACLVIGTAVSDIEMKSIPADIIAVMKNLGFTFKKEIIWVKPKGVQGLWQRGTTQFLKSKPFPCCLNLNIAHEYILIFQKGGQPEFKFTEEDKLSEEFIKKVAWSVWELDVSKTKGHPAPFPEELVKRLILLYSFKGETVLDPFLGSGTTTKVACELSRNSIGYEINIEYLELIKKKIGYQKPLHEEGQPEFQIIIRQSENVKSATLAKTMA